MKSINNGDILVSRDVSSLFTNVPSEETVRLLAEKAFANNWLIIETPGHRRGFSLQSTILDKNSLEVVPSQGILLKTAQVAVFVFGERVR